MPRNYKDLFAKLEGLLDYVLGDIFELIGFIVFVIIIIKSRDDLSEGIIGGAMVGIIVFVFLSVFGSVVLRQQIIPKHDPVYNVLRFVLDELLLLIKTIVGLPRRFEEYIRLKPQRIYPLTVLIFVIGFCCWTLSKTAFFDNVICEL